MLVGMEGAPCLLAEAGVGGARCDRISLITMKNDRACWGTKGLAAVGAGTGRDAGVGAVEGIGRAVVDGLGEGLIALFVCVPRRAFVEGLRLPSPTLEPELGVEVVSFIDTPFPFVRFELSFLAPSRASTSALRLTPLTPLAFTAAEVEVVERTPFLLDETDPRDGPPCRKRQLGRWHDSSGHGSAAKRPRLRNMAEVVTVAMIMATQGSKSMVTRGTSLCSVSDDRVAVRVQCCEDES